MRIAVVVDKCDDPAARVHHTEVAASGHAQVALAAHDRQASAGQISLDYRKAPVYGVVIHHDDLEIIENLRHQMIEAFADDLIAVVVKHDHTNPRRR